MRQYKGLYLVFWYLICINILVFLLWGVDKYIACYNARYHKSCYRIPEKVLLLGVLLGGGVGGLLGIECFRHKKSKGFFLWQVFFILAVHIVLLVIFFYRYES